MEVPATTSVPTQAEVTQSGTAILVTEESPQTKKLGKSIPPNPSARQA